MTNENRGHRHHGKSTRDILDPDRVIKAIGLRKGQKILDAGCGDGHISLAVSPFVGDGGMVYALDDYQPSLLQLKSEMEEEGIKNITPLEADLTSFIPLKDESVDMCIMANVLHGFTDKIVLKAVLNEIKRVLKPGGTFAVVEFIKMDGPPGPSYNIRLTPEQVESILEMHGFRIGGTEEVGKYHYLVESFKE